MNKIKDQIPAKYGYIKLISDTQNSKVVLVEEKSSKNRLILKLFYPDSPFYKGIFEEYVFTKEIQHPNLISILDTGVTGNDIFYYVLPYYKKEDPIVLCKKHGKQVFLDIFWQCLKGLSFLHNRNKVHGDISLDNIIIHKTGDKPEVKISDFGLSTLIVANKITDVSGTAYFLAPELVTDTSKPQMTEQSDLYAFGKYLEILLTGKMDTFENPWEMLKKRITVNKLKIEPLFDIEDEIVSVVRKLIEIDPKNRYSSIQEVVKDIYPFLIKNEVDISYNRFMETGVKINLYRKSIIDRIVSKVDDNKFIRVNGNETNAFHETINYLKAKLNFSKRKVIEITNSMFFNDFSSNLLQNFAKTEKLSDILHKEIIFFINKKLFSKNLTEILAIGTDNESLKFVIINNSYLHDDTISAIKIRNYNTPKLSKKEFDRYLALVFGNEKFPAVFRDYIFSNAYYNLELINEFIQIAQIQGAILQKNLKWEFHPEKLQPDFLSQKIKSKYLSKLNSLNKETFHFLVQISFWHQEFSIKEISDIFQISYSDVIEFTKIAEKAGILTNHSRKMRFMYDFMRIELQKNIIRQSKKSIREKVITYLLKQKKTNYKDELLLLKLLRAENEKKEILIFCNSLLEKYKFETKLLPFIEVIWKQKNDFIKIDLEKTFHILLSYSSLLIKSSNHIESKNVISYLDSNISKIKNNLMRSQFFSKKLFLFLKDKNYSEIINYDIEHKKEIDTLSVNEKLQCLFTIGDAYNAMNQFEESVQKLMEIITICEKKTEFLEMHIYSLSRLGFRFFQKQSLKKSLEYFEKALEKAKVYGSFHLIGYLYARVAFIQILILKVNEAQKNINKANSLAKKAKVSYYSLVISFIQAKINLYSGDYYKSMTSFHRNILDSKKAREKIFYSDLALPLIEIGYFRQAKNLINKTLLSAREDKAYLLIDELLTSLLRCYYKAKNTDMFQKILDEIKINRQYFSAKSNYESFYWEALLYIEQSDFTSARKIIAFLKNNYETSFNPNIDISYLHLNFLIYAKSNKLQKSLPFIKKTEKKLRNVQNKFIFAPDIYYDAYLITQKAFQENLTTENYKKFLNTAYKLIQKRKNNLPTNPMRRTYLGQKNVKKIIDEYEEEMKKTKFNKSDTLLLEFLEKISQIVIEVTDEKKLFNKILEIAILVTGAERGLIITLSHDTNELEVRHSYQVEDDSIEDVTTVSKKIIKEVFSKKKAVYNTKVSSNKEFDPYQSFVNLKIESVICLPLIIHKQILGTVYLDSRSLLAFSPDEIKFLNIFAQITSSAIETSRYYCQMEEEKRNMEKFLSVERRGHKNIIASSPQMMEILKKVEQIAPTDVNVLIEGESGTGKELIAKDIHLLSKRNNKLFIPIDCGSLSENIIESELFGHIKGAFTGAVSDKKGLFEEANGGTVFLDEISNLSLNMQTKLLRLLQEGEFKRVGENKVRRTNVRLITASNIPLKKLVIEAKFRQDLYYRLSIFPIELPALRERKGDIALLAKHFLNYFNSIHHKDIIGFEENTLRILEKYKWDGNVRQLQNEIERAVIICEKKRLTEKEFRHLGESTFPQDIIISQTSDTFNEQVNNFKLTLIENTLEECDNKWTKAAEKLGISRQNLRQIYKRMKEK